MRSRGPLNREKTVHLTLFTMGEIFIIFSIFSDIYYFSKYMKNKIGILENDRYCTCLDHQQQQQPKK